MCGFLGAVGPESIRMLNSLPDVKGRIDQRGPDSQGLADFGDLGWLYATRLAFQDKRHLADQPFEFEQPRASLAYNGEAFNLATLKDRLRPGHQLRTLSDTEVVGRLILEQDWGGLEAIDGPWAFALWSHRDRSVLLGRDPQARRPLYYAPVGTTLVFGSDASAVAELVGAKRGLTQTALAQYLLMGFVGPAETGFLGIHALEPGRIARWSTDSTQMESLAQCQPPLPTFSDRVTESSQSSAHLRHTLIAAVGNRLGQDETTAISLSGGVDSTAILLAALASKPDIRTFSMLWSDSDKARYSEDCLAARSIASKLNVQFQEVQGPRPKDIPNLLDRFVRSIGSPNANPTSVSQLYMQDVIRSEGIRITLTGDGADEIFLGYPRYAQFSIAGTSVGRVLTAMGTGRNAFRKQPRSGRAAALRRRLNSPSDFWARASWHWIFSPHELSALAQVIPEPPKWCGDILTSISDAPGSYRSQAIATQAKWDLLTWLRGEVNPVSDAVSMFTGGEIRTPFQSRSVFDALTSYPVNLRLPAMSKFELRAAFPELGALPMLTSKRGYVSPVGYWLRGNQDYVLDHISSLPGQLDVSGSELNILVNSFFRQPGAVEPRQVWALIVLAQWLNA